MNLNGVQTAQGILSYQHDHVHYIEECYHLRSQVDELIKVGKLMVFTGRKDKEVVEIDNELFLAHQIYVMRVLKKGKSKKSAVWGGKLGCLVVSISYPHNSYEFFKKGQSRRC